jgi:rhodanese-related sulfurtransferase
MKRPFQLVILVIALALGSAVSECAAAVDAPSTAFCGINSLYTGMRVIGIDADLRSMLSRKYVSSTDGSTYADLMQAAEDQHVSAEVVENLSYDQLAAMHSPCILHVRPEYDSVNFTHFVLIIPQSTGGLILYDAPTPSQPVSASELAALWDGSAMIIGQSPESLPALSRNLSGPLKLGGITALALIGLMLIRSSVPRWMLATSTRNVLIHAALLVCVSAAAGAAFHRWSDGGYFRQMSITQMIAKSRFVSPARKLDLAQFQKRVDERAIVVDARFVSDFREDHVPGAISIPPDTSHVDRQKLLNRVDRHAAIAVYCAGPSCPYASILANRLMRDGFDHVEVFPGGWEQWNTEAAPAPVSIAEVK